MEKSKSRAILVAQDMCHLDYAFIYSSEGRITIYAEQRDLSTLMSRLTQLVRGFKYHSDGGVRYFELTEDGGERIYLESTSNYKPSSNNEQFD